MSSEDLEKLVTDIAVHKMKSLDEYKPVFELINSLEKDITESCIKAL